jgi:hypothetical protein
MKKFFLTRFAVSIFDEDWINYRIELFKAIYLPSFEAANIDNEYYIVLLIDTDTPIASKEKLNKTVSDSKISANIHILEVDWYFEFEDAFKTFIKEHTDENETIIQARLDSDDAIAVDFLRNIDKNILKYNKPKMLITFPKIYDFWIEKKEIYSLSRPFFSNNTYLITDDREVTSYHVGHHDMGNWAKSADYKV